MGSRCGAGTSTRRRSTWRQAKHGSCRLQIQFVCASPESPPTDFRQRAMIFEAVAFLCAALSFGLAAWHAPLLFGNLSESSWTWLVQGITAALALATVSLLYARKLRLARLHGCDAGRHGRDRIWTCDARTLHFARSHAGRGQHASGDSAGACTRARARIDSAPASASLLYWVFKRAPRR